MPSLDTNALLRWLIADVPAQTARVDALLATGERPKLSVTDVSLTGWARAFKATPLSTFDKKFVS